MPKSCYYAYIGTNSLRGSRGIYTLEIDPAGETARVISAAPAYNSGALALSPGGGNLYAVTEGMTFRGLAQGGVTAYQVLEDGTLRRQSGVPSGGQRTCSLFADEQEVYACNFIYGTWCACPVGEAGDLLPARLVVGSPARNAPRTGLHAIGILEEDYVGVISIEHNELIVFRREDGGEVTRYAFPEMTMPRSFVTLGRNLYVLLQMPDEVFCFETDLKGAGTVRLVERQSLSDGTHPRMGGASAIRATPDGRFILAASRPASAISVFARGEAGSLRLTGVYDLTGRGPRDFHISRDGEILVAAMLPSDEVCIMKIDRETGALRQMGNTVNIPSPAAVAVSGRCDHG